MSEPYDHIIVCRNDNNGIITIYNEFGTPFMEEWKAREREDQWRKSYPYMTYRVVKVAPHADAKATALDAITAALSAPDVDKRLGWSLQIEAGADSFVPNEHHRHAFKELAAAIRENRP